MTKRENMHAHRAQASSLMEEVEVVAAAGMVARVAGRVVAGVEARVEARATVHIEVPLCIKSAS